MPLSCFLYQWYIISIYLAAKKGNGCRPILPLSYLYGDQLEVRTITLCLIKRSIRATITLYFIFRLNRANIKPYPGIVILLVMCNISEYE